MSYPRNATSPPHFLVGYVYQISDGAVQTAGVSARVKTGTGSWGAAAGTLDCDTTSGAWTYTPTQAETNAEAFSVSLYKASCSGVGMTVITGKSSTAGYVAPDWGQVLNPSSTVGLNGTTIKAVTDAVTLPSSASINITGNITGNLSGSVGSVTGAVGSVTGNVGGSVASVTGAVGSVTGNVGGNVTGSVGSVVSGVTVTTNNDKTGYSLTQAFPNNFSSLAITAGGAVTAGTVSDKTGYSLTQAFPTNFSSLGINSSGHLSRVTLVDTTTTNTDMRGTDGAALATHWTSTRAGYLDSVLIAANANQRTVHVTGSAHIAADIHELQPAVIEAQHFALGAIDANAVAADASSEIATAVRSELAVELARIDVTNSSRLADADYTAPPSATTIADTVLGRSVANSQATAAEWSLATLVLAVLESNAVGSTWTIYRTDGTTVHAVKTLATDANADPVVGVS